MWIPSWRSLWTARRCRCNRMARPTTIRRAPTMRCRCLVPSALRVGHTNYGYDYADSYRTTSSGCGRHFRAPLRPFGPSTKLTVSTNFNYTDSLLGSIPEPMQNGVVQTVSLGTFRSYLFGTNAYYQLLPSLSLTGRSAMSFRPSSARVTAPPSMGAALTTARRKDSWVRSPLPSRRLTMPPS